MEKQFITLVSASGNRKDTSISALTDMIRNGNHTALQKLTEDSARLTFEKREEWERKVPAVIWGARYKSVRSQMEWSQLTGLVVVEIDNLPGRREAVQLRQTVSQLLQVVVSFVSLSGRSLYVIFAFTLPDGSLPQDRKNAEMFYAHAYLRAVKYLSAQLNCYIAEQKPDPDRSVRISSDPGIRYNPDALPILMQQPLAFPSAPKLKDQLQDKKDPVQRMLPGYERSRAIHLIYQECYRKVLDKEPQLKWEEPERFLAALAEECSRSRVPEEDMVKYVRGLSFFRDREAELRLTVRNVYRTIENSEGKNKQIPSGTQNLQHLQFLEFMKRRYLFRYNVLKECVEYHTYSSAYFDFVPVTQRELNGICVDAHDEGLFIWDRDVKRYLHSNRVAVFDPLEEYLEELPAWDGTDHIRALAGQIRTSREGWTEQFYKWFVYMVAQWIHPHELHANSTVPVLVGKQGYHKSTFCRMLLPPELRDYYKEHVDIRKKKEAEWCLPRFALINLDEFDSIRPADHAYLKHLLQKTEVFEKDSTTHAATRKRRVASFIATCNTYDLLSDPTGSRRYLCLELTGDFEFNRFPDYGQLYAQAREAILSKEQYWFTHKEEGEIMEANEPFQQVPMVEELFLLYFEDPAEGESFEILSSTEILQRLKKFSRAALEINQKTLRQLGLSLRKLNIRSHRTYKASGYIVKQKKFD